MAQAVVAPSGDSTLAELEARPILLNGILAGGSVVFLATIGMLEAFSDRSVVDPIINLGYLALAWLPMVLGYRATHRPTLEGVGPPPKGIHNLIGGALTGLISGAIMGLFILLIDAIFLRDIFPNISPPMIDLITFSKSNGYGVVVMVVSGTVLGAVGGSFHLMTSRWRRALISSMLYIVIVGLLELVIGQILREFGLGFIDDAMYSRDRGLTLPAATIVAAAAFAITYTLPEDRPPLRTRIAAIPPERRRNVGLIAAAVFIVLGVFLPMIFGSFLNELMTSVGLFLLMGLGLNVVVGFAGLLDLGYVAFFAVGAYTMAILTSPGSPQFNPELSFWLAIPFVLLAAAVAGIMVGTPVLRMRGDYLAIVTLGFGEIARVLFGSDWFKPVFGGAQGILQIPSIQLGPVTIKGTNTQAIFYFILVFVIIAAYVSWRLQDSRVGRAWMAMREDEQVAEVMGINTVTAKLTAFITGAVLASFGGALFAVKIGSVFPNSFALIVSIIVLVLIIVGGMGNIPGVAIGALVLVGILGGPTQPGLLREFESFKLLIYGALLIYMMLNKPEGLLPSTRRAQELHQEEFLQDAWLKQQAAAEATPEGAP